MQSDVWHGTTRATCLQAVVNRSQGAFQYELCTTVISTVAFLVLKRSSITKEPDRIWLWREEVWGTWTKPLSCNCKEGACYSNLFNWHFCAPCWHFSTRVQPHDWPYFLGDHSTVLILQSTCFLSIAQKKFRHLTLNVKSIPFSWSSAP